mgnify:CR=1 FL=1
MPLAAPTPSSRSNVYNRFTPSAFMKTKHYILTAVISYLVLLIATIPATSLNSVLGKETPVNIQGISGTLWEGKAYLINIDNKVKLEDTQWSFSLWRLFLGQLALDIDTNFAGNPVTAEIGSSFLGRIFINDLKTEVDAAKVSELAQIPLAQLSGAITLDIEHAQWKQGELPMATGTINWSNATVTVADTASLGNISVTLGENEQQLLNADIKNQGGDINLRGNAELVPEADYSVNMVLIPTASANRNIKNSLSLFAKKQSNGEYHLKNSGSLTQLGLM